ncbi:MAG TPA: hypothetical protein VF297_15590 [Pyrinomonadaceae bacterium]
MRRLKTLTLFTAALLTLAFTCADVRAQQPTQTSLVKAWEEVQKDDPETVTFEKVGERTYRFKTNRFPFDGELKVLKATVNQSEYAEDGTATGVIEYDLVGLSDEVEKKYEHSLENWEATNSLYFDGESKSWLSSEQYSARMSAKSKEIVRTQQQRQQDKEQTGLWLWLASTWGPLFGLAGFWAWLMKKSGLKNQRQYMNMATLHMQRSEEQMELNREHMKRAEELLARIAAAVETAERAKQ